jgi:hypothetical protein
MDWRDILIWRKAAIAVPNAAKKGCKGCEDGSNHLSIHFRPPHFLAFPKPQG